MAKSRQCKLFAVYFPLLAVVIPKWLNEINGLQNKGRKILFLISGQGTPRDESARVQDNSTEMTAKIMELFMQKEYPMIEVHLVHSQGLQVYIIQIGLFNLCAENLFRYDANISFVRTILLPRIQSIRNDLALRQGSKWVENLHLAISFADGSSARISAINAALRQYRYETIYDDIDIHGFTGLPICTFGS